MRAAVICEFNPFHNGHKFLIEKIKNSCADEVVCVMSGAFVQRGDVAITDKFSRARTALLNGADIVAELPTVYAVSPAQVFAENSVRLAYELGCEKLCFGAESSLEELKEALAILDADETQEEIASLMRAGTYYPRALSEAVGDGYAGVISKPNNILALEYIRACEKFGVEPIAVPRKGADHDSTKTSGDIASGSKIRDMIKNGEDYSRYSPSRIEKAYSLDSGLEALILYSLKSAKPTDSSDIAGISEGIDNLLYKYAQMYNSLEEILTAAKTKRYTMARLRRAALSISLGITAAMQSAPVPYVRVLGVRKDKTGLISSRSLPLIVDVRRGYDGLSSTAKEVFDIDLKAADYLNSSKLPTSPLNEFTHGIIKV